MNTRKLRNVFYDISKELLIMESHSMETKKRMLSYKAMLMQIGEAIQMDVSRSQDICSQYAEE